MRIRIEIPQGLSKECFRMLNELMQSSSVLPLAVQSPSVGSPTLMKLLPRHFQMKKPYSKSGKHRRKKAIEFFCHVHGMTAQRVCQSLGPVQPRKRDHAIRDSIIRIWLLHLCPKLYHFKPPQDCRVKVVLNLINKMGNVEFEQFNISSTIVSTRW